MNTRTTIILLIVALGLGGGVMWMLDQEQKAALEDTSAGLTAGKDLFSPKPAETVQLRISRADGATRVFEMRGDEWCIREPVAAQVMKHAVEADVREVADLQYLRKFEPGAGDMPGDDITGLKNPNVVVTLTGRDGATHTLKVGNLRPLSTESYVARDDDPAVYVVRQDLVERFAKPLTEYREKRIVQTPSDEVTQVEVQGLQNYVMVNTDGRWVLDKPVRSRTDQAKGNELVQAAVNLFADSFVADNPTNLRIYGLSQPQLRVTVTSQKRPAATQSGDTQPAGEATSPQSQPAEVKVTTLLVGAKTGNLYFAKIEDEPAVFRIAEATFKTLSTPLADVRDKAIAGIDPEKVGTLEMESSGRTIRLAKAPNGSWLMTGLHTGKAELSAVDDLLKAITQARATAFEDEAGPLTRYGFEQPRARIKMAVTGQVAPVEILIGNNTPSGEMVFVKNTTEETVAVLKKGEVDGLLVEPGSLLDRSVMRFAGDAVSRIEVMRGGQKNVLVRGEGGQWRLSEPVDAPADRDAVQAILADLSNLRARKVAATDSAVDFGFAEPAVVVAVHVQERASGSQPTSQPTESQPASQPAEKVYTLLVARDAQDGAVHGRLEGGDWTYQLDPVIHVHLGAELHERAVMNFEAEQVAGIRIPSEGEQSIELARQGEKWVYLADPYVQIDAAKVKEYLGTLRDVKAERFVAYNMTSPADYGLDQPLMEAEVKLDSGKVVTLVIAKATDTRRYVATIAGTTAAFELPTGFVQQLRRPLSFFKGQ